MRVLSKRRVEEVLKNVQKEHPGPWSPDLRLFEFIGGRPHGLVDTDAQRVRTEAEIGRVITDIPQALQGVGVSLSGVKYVLVDTSVDELIASDTVQENLRVLAEDPSPKKCIEACENITAFYVTHPQLHARVWKDLADMECEMQLKESGTGPTYSLEIGYVPRDKGITYDRTIYEAVERVVRGASYKEKTTRDTEGSRVTIEEYRPPRRTDDKDELAQACSPHLIMAGIGAMADMACADGNITKWVAMGLLFNRDHPEEQVRAETLKAYGRFLKPPLPEDISNVMEFIRDSTSPKRENSAIVREEAKKTAKKLGIKTT